MPFNLGNGLSAMGTAIVANSVENQKADLEMEKVKLADQLAGAREEKGRQFQTSERIATQQFTGEENTKNRANAVDIAKIGLQGSLAQAGATVASAQIHAAIIGKQMEQNAPLIKAQIEQSKATTVQEQTKTASLVIANSAATEKEAALQAVRDAGDDPAKQAAAKARLDIANWNQNENVAAFTAASTLAKVEQDNLRRLTTEMAAGMNQDPAKQKMIQDEMRASKERYDALIANAQRVARSMPQMPGGGAPAGAPSLDKLIPPPATGTAAPGAVTPPPGIINNNTPPGAAPNGAM